MGNDRQKQYSVALHKFPTSTSIGSSLLEGVMDQTYDTALTPPRCAPRRTPPLHPPGASLTPPPVPFTEGTLTGINPTLQLHRLPTYHLG